MADPIIDPGADPEALLQRMLDMISNEPGSILYRGPDGWVALAPTQAGDVLTLSDDLLPVWLPD